MCMFMEIPSNKGPCELLAEANVNKGRILF